MTKRPMAFAIICLILAPMGTPNAHAQDKLPLQRVQTIPMPGVSGRMDHLGVDVEGGRLFAAALGNTQNTVEVIDLKAGKRIFSISGQSMPQGVFYSADFKKLFVANGARTALSRASAGTVSSFLTACQSAQIQITWATTRQPNISMSALAFPIPGQELCPLSRRAPINKLESSGRIPAPAASRSRHRGPGFS